MQISSRVPWLKAHPLPKKILRELENLRRWEQEEWVLTVIRAVHVSLGQQDNIGAHRGEVLPVWVMHLNCALLEASLGEKRSVHKSPHMCSILLGRARNAFNLNVQGGQEVLEVPGTIQKL